MEISRQDFEWCCAVQALTPAHADQSVNPSSPNVIVLKRAAAHALLSGHIMHFACNNIAVQRGFQLQVQLEGNPGEAPSARAMKENWAKILAVASQLGMAVDTGASVSSVREALAAVGDLRRAYSSAQRKPGRDRKDRRQEVTHGAASQSMSSSTVGMSASVSPPRRRSISNSAKSPAGLNPILRVDKQPRVFKEVVNRRIPAMCLGILLDVVDRVVSGEARAEIDRKSIADQHVRETQRMRKVRGQRLVDNHRPLLALDRRADHVAGLLCRDIVLDIVTMAMSPDAMPVLAQREEQRHRERQLVAGVLARNEGELSFEEGRLPLRMRREREKTEEARRKAELQAARDAQLEQWRDENRQRAAEHLTERVRKDLSQARAAALHKQEEQRRKEERNLYYSQARLTMELRHVEDDGVMGCVAIGEEEASRRAAIQRRFTKEYAVLTAPPEPERVVAPRLPLDSSGSGEQAAGLGGSLGTKFLTREEHGLLEALRSVRTAPTTLVARLKNELVLMGQGKLRLWDTTNGSGVHEPMATAEGPLAITEAISAMQRARPCHPTLGAPTLGLTLAARQHAIDLAFNGIAACNAHVGAAGGSLATRVARYGAHSRQKGTTELVFGIVRPATVCPTAEDVILSWAVDDGFRERPSRQGLLLTGPATSSVGIGHALAEGPDNRFVEIYVVLFAHPFVDKPIAELAEAHDAQVSAIAAGFLVDDRRTSPAVTHKSLSISTNSVVGRSGPPPNLKRLTKQTESSKTNPANNPKSRAEQGSAKSPVLAHSPSLRGSPGHRRRSPSRSALAHTNGSRVAAPEAARTILRPPSDTRLYLNDDGIVVEVRVKDPSPPPADEPSSEEEENVEESDAEAEEDVLPEEVDPERVHLVVLRAVAKFICFGKRCHRRHQLHSSEESLVQEQHEAAARIASCCRMFAAKCRLRARRRRVVGRSSMEAAFAIESEEAHAAVIIETAVRGLQARAELRRRDRAAAVEPVFSAVMESVNAKITSLVLQQRVRDMYAKHEPQKIELGKSLLKRHEGKEEELLQGLVGKHGPEPEAQAQLENLFRRHDPSKLLDVFSLLVEHAGHEDELFQSLEEKYNGDHGGHM